MVLHSNRNQPLKATYKFSQYFEFSITELRMLLTRTVEPTTTLLPQNFVFDLNLKFLTFTDFDDTFN